MKEWKLIGIVLVESILSLALGLFIMKFALEPLYELQGIKIRGDIWVVWFAVAILLFSIYTLLFSSVVNYPMKKRLRSKKFWILFAISIVILLVPWVNGEIPY
ncbi:hypothetical protein ACFSTA_01485 [Ornithinibacillus salinisoli]|uniref:Uncharacterized protein n=1 Tax=Ornithinibacillus salinisoli TaxID=1848459 RepID=A0ABW4VYI6_9BACI